MPLFELPTFEEEQLKEIQPSEIDFAERREKGNERREEDAGVFKPLVQFANVGTSPDMNLGAAMAGPVNGVSKLTNAIGDMVFKDDDNPLISAAKFLLVDKPRRHLIDTSDAWIIPDEAIRAQRTPTFDFKTGGFISGDDQGVIPADKYALPFAKEIGGEALGLATYVGAASWIKRLGFFKSVAGKVRQTQLMKSLAVAAQKDKKLRAGIKGTQFTAEAFIEQMVVAPFIDNEEGNVMDLFPENQVTNFLGRSQAGDDYITKTEKNIRANGLVALPLLGAAQFVPSVRKWMTTGDIGWLDELGKAEIDPYLPHINKTDPLKLPEGKQGGALTLHRTDSSSIATADTNSAMVPTPGGAITKYDSAISRSLDEQTQINQVREQRERLANMGLTELGDGDQLELSVGQVADPEIKVAIEAIRKQRNVLLKQAATTGEDLTEKLTELDVLQDQVLEQGLGGQSFPDLLGTSPQQLDLPDPRKEIDHLLADLDELSDEQLIALKNEVSAPTRRRLREQLIQEQSEKVAAFDAQFDEINQRLDIGKQELAEKGKVKKGLTDKGAQRKITQAQKELQLAQQELDRLKESGKIKNPLVGDQLEFVLDEGVAPDQPARKGDWSDKDFDIQRREFADEAGFNRFIQALDRAFGHEWVNEPIETIGNALNVLNIGRVFVEEGTQKAGRDIARLTPLAKKFLKKARELKKKGIQINLPKQEVKRNLPSQEQITQYTENLSQLGRDDLRSIAAPSNSPEVAAIVKQRTGRRVWSAKKQDIINAFIEYYERSGRFIELNEVRQLDIDLGDTRSTTPLTKLADSEGVESAVPTFDLLNAEKRETFKAEILRIAIENGEVQSPKTPIPEKVPTTDFNQASFLDDMLSDESGQLAFLYSTDQLPTYKAGGKNSGALVEEMRLRYEYLLQDEFGKKAIREAQMAFEGWDEMTWDQKKSRLSSTNAQWGTQFNPELEIKGAREGQAYTKTGTEFKAELKAQPPRKPQPHNNLHWTPEGVVPEEVAKKPVPPEVKKAEAKADAAVVKESETGLIDIQAKRAELEKAKQKLIDDSNGASC
tara:strand:+ start:79 stop:3255 length:3177 start_codon:yes stop_codon:yes gene_type:complete